VVDELRGRVIAWKYITRYGDVSPHDGLPTGSTQHLKRLKPVARPFDMDRERDHVYLQPMDEYDRELNYKNMQAAARACMDFGYRLGVQIHKLADLE
jgi:hypothetical protein